MTTHPFRLSIVLGTNEIASAVAVYLHRAGQRVVLAHDPNPPVIRRGMAFHDALYDDVVAVDGVTARRVDRWSDLQSLSNANDTVAVTTLGLLDLIVYGPIDALIDARLQKRVFTPDLRHLAGVAVGIGPGFRVGANCDVAVETRPGHAAAVLTRGTTAPPDRLSCPLGGVGRERFVYSSEPGRWRSAVEIGRRVFVGFPVGHLDGVAVAAPMDGILRGAVRDGLEVPAGVKLIEVDPRGRRAQWTGIDDRPRGIAEATLAAVRTHVPDLVPG